MCLIDTDEIRCPCADIEPQPLVFYQRHRGRVEGLDPPAHRHKRCQSALDSLRLDVERLLEGVTDNGWKHLNNDLIVACYHAPVEWIPLMRRIAVATEYVRAVAQGDVLVEEEEDT